jgi:hypothetical protein
MVSLDVDGVVVREFPESDMLTHFIFFVYFKKEKRDRKNARLIFISFIIPLNMMVQDERFQSTIQIRQYKSTLLKG